MPSEFQKEMDELLQDSERHMCATLQDHWSMITIKNGNATIWNNALGNPQGEAEILMPIIFDIKFCPFCGKQLSTEPEIS